MALRLAMALGAGVLAGSAHAAPPSSCAVAAIAVEPGAGGVTLTGRAVALADCRFSASMTVERSGQAGAMKTTQGGSFSLDKGQSASVATVGVSISAGDHLEVVLVLSFDGREIATSSLRVGE
jgi:hypothetical protein